MQIKLPIGVSFTVVERTSSTMDLARCYDGSAGFPHWILAKVQDQARGRRGRLWIGNKESFAATLIMKPKCTPLIASQYSFVAACALFRSLGKYVDVTQLAQKWPNDVLLNGGKVAGILLESSGTGHSVDRLSIGVGVNLGSAPKNVKKANFVPVGLSDVIGKSIRPEEFLENLAYNFNLSEQNFKKYGFVKICEEWTGQACRLGEVITAHTGKEEYQGQFEGIDANGNLVLLTSSGKRVIPSADVCF